MFEDLLPGISSYELISVAVVVVLSESLKRLMPTKLKSNKKIFSGLYFLFPLLLSLAVTLAEYIGGVKTEWKALAHDVIKLFGMSVLLYETIGKRVFPKQGGSDAGESNNSSSSSSVVSNPDNSANEQSIESQDR